MSMTPLIADQKACKPYHHQAHLAEGDVVAETLSTMTQHRPLSTLCEHCLWEAREWKIATGRMIRPNPCPLPGTHTDLESLLHGRLTARQPPQSELLALSVGGEDHWGERCTKLGINKKQNDGQGNHLAPDGRPSHPNCSISKFQRLEKELRNAKGVPTQ